MRYFSFHPWGTPIGGNSYSFLLCGRLSLVPKQGSKGHNVTRQMSHLHCLMALVRVPGHSLSAQTGKTVNPNVLSPGLFTELKLTAQACSLQAACRLHKQVSWKVSCREGIPSPVEKSYSSHTPCQQSIREPSRIIRKRRKRLSSLFLPISD